MKTTKQMIIKARAMFPNSLHLQHQWVRKTTFLMSSNKHALQTGGWTNIGEKYEKTMQA